MQNRRDFLKTAAFAALGSSVAINSVFAGESTPSLFNINKSGVNARMKLRFFPYELKLRHVFTVATYSRTTTPDVQVEIEYDGITGYGEASMPPYLQKELGTMESVMAFLKKVQDVIGQFPDPFQLEDILAYVDKLSPGDAAAKAAVDIALHDLVGKLLQAPWYKIWGLDKDKAPSTTFTIGIDTPEVVREKTKECADQFNILKVKLGRENDKEMIETIRSVTSLPIAVDANQGWTDKHYAIVRAAGPQDGCLRLQHHRLQRQLLCRPGAGVQDVRPVPRQRQAHLLPAAHDQGSGRQLHGERRRLARQGPQRRRIRPGYDRAARRPRHAGKGDRVQQWLILKKLLPVSATATRW